MFQAIRAVRKKTHEITAQDGHCTIQQLSNLVEAYTAIDEARYIGYDAEVSNPVWGEFLRWSQFVPYSPEKTIVEIRYARHLSTANRRFVIAKELCHCLDNDKGSHTASDESVTNLVTELALLSVASTAQSTLTPATLAEKLAEYGAVELMMPIDLRKAMIANGEFAQIGVPGMMEKFQMPSRYVELAFRADYISVIEGML